MTFNANALYETINYSWALVSACMIIFLISTLYESWRELGWRTFLFDRPGSEQFMIAILFADGGNMIDRLARGAWRSIGSDLDTVGGLLVALIIGGSALGMLGVLCKLRIVSIARHGHWPWIAAATVTIVFGLSYWVLRELA